MYCVWLMIIDWLQKLLFERSCTQARKDVQLPCCRLNWGWVYQQKKMYPEAITELQKAVNLSNRHEVPLASLGQVLGESGRKEEATKILEELKLRSEHQYVSPCLIALVQIGLGERDQAIASLEQGYTNRDQWMLYLKVDPHMDGLRSDPRFRDLLRRIGLPQMPSP